MVPRLVHKIEGGYPERDIGAEEEEGQGWGDSRRLIWKKFQQIHCFGADWSEGIFNTFPLNQIENS